MIAISKKWLLYGVSVFSERGIFNHHLLLPLPLSNSLSLSRLEVIGRGGGWRDRARGQWHLGYENGMRKVELYKKNRKNPHFREGSQVLERKAEPLAAYRCGTILNRIFTIWNDFLDFYSQKMAGETLPTM